MFEVSGPFLNQLSQLGIGYTFFTNNSSKSTGQYVEHLTRMGIRATPADIYSSTHATMDYLRAELPGVTCLYVLGTAALREEFSQAGDALLKARPASREFFPAPFAFVLDCGALDL